MASAGYDRRKWQETRLTKRESDGRDFQGSPKPRTAHHRPDHRERVWWRERDGRRARPDRLDDSTWRTLEYLAGMTRRVDEYGTPDGEDPLGYDTRQPPEVYLRQMADALTGRHARAVES